MEHWCQPTLPAGSPASDLKAGTSFPSGLSDVAVAADGNVIFITGANLYMIPSASFQSKQCAAVPLGALPNPATSGQWTGFGNGFLSNLFYASSRTGNIATIRYVPDATQPSRVTAQLAGVQVVSNCASGTDITAGPDGSVSVHALCRLSH